MLIPRFSIRWLLGLTTLCAGVSLVLAQAVRGQPWAIGVMVAIGSLLLVACVYAATFGVAWVLWRSLGGKTGAESPSEGSPFGDAPLATIADATVVDSPPIAG